MLQVEYDIDLKATSYKRKKRFDYSFPRNEEQVDVGRTESEEVSRLHGTT